jgi:formate/nitrite transporter FocA (FNT family)
MKMMETLNNKGGYMLLSLFAGYLVGICPITAFILGLSYNDVRQGKAKLGEAFIYIGLGLVGQIIEMLTSSTPL